MSTVHAGGVCPPRLITPPGTTTNTLSASNCTSRESDADTRRTAKDDRIEVRHTLPRVSRTESTPRRLCPFAALMMVAALDARASADASAEARLAASTPIPPLPRLAKLPCRLVDRLFRDLPVNGDASDIRRYRRTLGAPARGDPGEFKILGRPSAVGLSAAASAPRVALEPSKAVGEDKKGSHRYRPCKPSASISADGWPPVLPRPLLLAALPLVLLPLRLTLMLARLLSLPPP